VVWWLEGWDVIRGIYICMHVWVNVGIIVLSNS